MTIVVNLFGGPGTGKSTVMADIFARLKWKGINCEMAPEFAKEKVWEESFKTLGNQIYVFGKQQHSIYRLLDKVDVIITDSPLLFSCYYGKGSASFHALVWEQHERLDSINIFLEREKEYNPIGRIQNEEEAKKIDESLKMLLNDYLYFKASPESIGQIVETIENKLSLNTKE